MTPRVQPGFLSSEQASSLNSWIQRVDMFMGLAVVAPLQLSHPAGRPIIRAPGAPTPIRITGKLRSMELDPGSPGDPNAIPPIPPIPAETDGLPIPDCAYSWTALRISTTDCVNDLGVGVAGGYIDQVPAISISGDTAVATDSEIIAFLAPSGEYYMFGGAGGGCSGTGNVGCIQLVTDVVCDTDLGFQVNKYNFYFPPCLGIKVWANPDGSDAACIACSTAGGLDPVQTEVFGVIVDDTPVDPPGPPAQHIYDPEPPGSC